MLKIEDILERIEDFYQTFKPKILRLFKSEIFRISVAIFAVLFLLTIALPLFFDNSALRFQIKQKISEGLAANLEIKGDVKIKFLPSTQIIVEDVLVQNYRPESQNLDVPKVYNFYAKKMIIEIPIFSFSGDFAAKKISFENAIIESFFDNEVSKVRDNILQKKLVELSSGKDPEAQGVGSGISAKIFPVSDIKINKENYKLPSLGIVEGDLISYDINGAKREIKNINLDFEISEKKLKSSGNFLSENIASEFEFLAKFNQKAGDDSSYFKLSSSVANIEIRGDFTGDNKIIKGDILDNNFIGKLKFDISQFSDFYKSYISANDLIGRNLKKESRSVAIDGEIVADGGEVQIRNINIKSSLFDGRGAAILSKKDKLPVIDVILNLENLDLDNLIGKEESNGSQLLANIAASVNQKELEADNSKDEKTINLDLKKARKLDLFAEISIKNVKYLNGLASDANIYIETSEGGNLLIMPLSIKIAGDGFVRLDGVIDNSLESGGKFVGKIEASGKNLGEFFKSIEVYWQNLKLESLTEYKLSSDILITPSEIFFSNSYLNFAKDGSEFLGDLHIINGEKNLDFVGNFRANRFDVDSYFFTAGSNVYLAPGSLLKKLLWLNNLTMSGKFKIKFDSLIYNKEIFKDQETAISFGAGYFEVEKITLNSENINLESRLLADIRTSNPQFEMEIKGKKLHYNTAQLGSFDEKSNNVKRNLFDQIYALPSLEDFNGKVAINIDDFLVDDIALRDLKIEGGMRGGIMNNSVASFGTYGGNLSYRGLLGIKIQKTINGNISFKDVDIKPLLTDLFAINNIEGIANISANLTSFAASKESFLSNLTSEIKFSANSPVVHGYGMSDLIHKMFALQNNRVELQNPENILFNKNAKSVFSQASGTFLVEGGKNQKLKINIKAPALNAILSGSFDLKQKTIDANLNAIFVTGDTRKQTPINVISNIKGSGDNIMQNTNMNQVRQYLGLPVSGDKGALLPAQESLAEELKKSGVIEKTMLIPSQEFPPNQALVGEASRNMNAELPMKENPQMQQGQGLDLQNPNSQMPQQQMPQQQILNQQMPKEQAPKQQMFEVPLQ